MNTGPGVIFFKKTGLPIEWKLLLFLVLFMDVKLAVKALRPDPSLSPATGLQIWFQYQAFKAAIVLFNCDSNSHS